MNEDVEQSLASQDAPIADLARRLCALILEVYPGAVITIDGGDIGLAAVPGTAGVAAKARRRLSPGPGSVRSADQCGPGLP
jgi:hypothetical protein